MSSRNIKIIPLIIAIFWFSSAQASDTVWDVMRQQFQLNHAVNQPEVQAELHWLLAHPNYLQSLTQSEPYMYHILTEIKKNNLPGEIALIPMIESAYNPFAYSRKGAAGLWQLMPHTAKDLGLTQDWWMDNRRGILSSTKVALDYLNYLSGLFAKDWLLAISAYDAGAGRISHLIESVHHKNVWQLPLPQETKTYIARLLALAEIVQQSDRYHIQLPNIPHKPYFQEIRITRPIDLTDAAKLAGMPYHELIKLNPAYNRLSMHPNQTLTLLIPRANLSRFQQNLVLGTKHTVLLKEFADKQWYTVREGDTLSSISNQNHISLDALLEKNPALKTSLLYPGQVLVISG